jgi:hypothetical protein
MNLAIAAAASAFALATPALAQDTFGTKNDFVFAADRLTGVYLFKQGNEKDTVLGLLQTPWGVNVYQTARIGFDWFPINHLSIGGTLSYWSLRREQDNGPGDVTTKEFLFAPRIGYAIPISKSFGFWPRGGISYRSTTVGDADANGEVALTFEAQFYASPAPHFAFIFGPVLDLGIAGDYDDKASNIGILTGGILGWI